jgi:hypothetical protein
MSEYKYIKYFPKPFLEDLVKGRVLPIIGAGFSKNAIVPKNKKMLDWDELGKSFAELIPDYTYNGAIDAISAYCHEYSRPKFVEKLSELLLTGHLKAGSTHRAFCNLPFQSVATTNFDFLLEQGYGLVSRYCRPVIEENQLAIAHTNPKEVTLFKIHGDLHHPDRIVASEEDYDGFLNRYPMISTFLANLFISKTVLYIGYSLDDPDLRQIHQLIKDRLGKFKRQAYTIRIDSTSQESTRFQRRDVKVINIPKGNKSYSIILEEIFDELRDYWTAEYPNIATITEEDPLIELTITKDNGEINRLCYFSIPTNAISLYKKYIFPIVESFGFAPMTVDDVLSPGNNFAAKISSLIERSSIVVVDTSSQNNAFELGIARTLKSKKVQLVVVKETNDDVLMESDITIINRRTNIFDDIDNVCRDFEEVFQRFYDDLQTDFEDEPSRLLGKKEYKAATISAMSLLEIQLRNKIEKKIDLRFKPASFKELLRLGTTYQLIDQKDFSEISEWIFIRNKLVHTTEYRIDFKTAKRIVSQVRKMVAEMKKM